jgi:hypothetical protein
MENSHDYELVEQYNCDDVAKFISSLKHETASKDDFEKIREILEEFDFDKCDAPFSTDMKEITQELFDELSKKFDETSTAERYLSLFQNFGGRKSKRGSKKRGSKKRGSKKRGSKKRGSKKRGSKKRS